MELLAHRDQAFQSSLGDFDRKPFAGMKPFDSERSGDLDPDLEATYRSYFVVQTAETPRRFQEDVTPSASLVDEEGPLIPPK